MSAVAAAVPVRVMVLPAWDRVALEPAPDTTVAALKATALERATGRRDLPAGDFLVKFRGGEVLDESRTIGDLGVPANGALVVMPRFREPVR